MKLIYVHQYFVTNEGTTGTRSYDVSRYLVEMGWQVTVVTGLHDQSSFARMPWWKLWRTEHIDGIKVVVCNAFYSNKLKVAARLWCFVKFAILSTMATIKEPGTDVIFATSTPLTVGIPGRIGAAVRRIPYVFEVRDLWPEDLLDAGRIKPGMQYKVWEWLELFSYRKARKILLVSKGFEDRLLERGFDRSRLETVVLGADSSLYASLKPDTEFFRRHGLEGKTIAVYTGAHGDANGLLQLIEAAEHLRDRPNIAIVLIGEGKMKERLRQQAADRGLTNFHLLDPVPKLQLPNILAACHIGLMILKQIKRPRWVTPNKIFDYMFAGIPSIVNFAGTTAEMVVTDGTGVASVPGDARDLAEKIAHWADDAVERERVGMQARKVALAKYDRKMIAKRLGEIFEQVARGQAPVSAVRGVACP